MNKYQLKINNNLFRTFQLILTIFLVLNIFALICLSIILTIGNVLSLKEHYYLLFPNSVIIFVLIIYKLLIVKYIIIGDNMIIVYPIHNREIKLFDMTDIKIKHSPNWSWAEYLVFNYPSKSKKYLFKINKNDYDILLKKMK